MSKMQQRHEEAIERVRSQSRPRSQTSEPEPIKSVTFQEEHLEFHSPNDKDPTASSSSSGIRQHDARDLNAILQEAEKRSLERDAKNQEKLDELRGIVIKLTKDHIGIENDLLSV